jgi:hypothetical protein
MHLSNGADSHHAKGIIDLEDAIEMGLGSVDNDLQAYKHFIDRLSIMTGAEDFYRSGLGFKRLAEIPDAYVNAEMERRESAFLEKIGLGTPQAVLGKTLNNSEWLQAADGYSEWLFRKVTEKTGEALSDMRPGVDWLAELYLPIWKK